MSAPGEQTEVLTALEDARHNLVAMHGLLAADGAAPDRRWTLNTTSVVEQLDRAISLCENETRINGPVPASTGEMKNYHLVPDGSRWKLTMEEDGTILFFDTKDDAVLGCADYVGEHPGSLKIHRADGTFEEERTYPRSADPVESKG